MCAEGWGGKTGVNMENNKWIPIRKESRFLHAREGVFLDMGGTRNEYDRKAQFNLQFPKTDRLWNQPGFPK